MLAGRGAVGARRLNVQVTAGQDIVEQSVCEMLLLGRGGIHKVSSVPEQIPMGGYKVSIFQKT